MSIGVSVWEFSFSGVVVTTIASPCTTGGIVSGNMVSVVVLGAGGGVRGGVRGGGVRGGGPGNGMG